MSCPLIPSWPAWHPGASPRSKGYTKICRIADEIQADAVVVGSSTQLGHRFVGSLALKLVRAGRWPVTVVP